jgi:hypothetical protein
MERLLKTWQARLGLDSWDITVDFDTCCSEACHATVKRSDTYDRATMLLDVEWESWDGVFAARTVVHELLHLLTRDIDEVYKSLESHLHRDVYDVVDSRYQHEIEGLVDRLSYRFVELGGG